MELTIKEGRNQQVRRMGEATGFPVMRLVRASFAGISSDGLKPGAWRPLTREELHNLKQSYGVPKSLPAPVAPQATEGRGRAGAGGRGVHAQVATVDFRGRARGKPGERPQPDKIHRGTDEQRESAGRRGPQRGARGARNSADSRDSRDGAQTRPPTGGRGRAIRPRAPEASPDTKDVTGAKGVKGAARAPRGPRRRG